MVWLWPAGRKKTRAVAWAHLSIRGNRQSCPGSVNLSWYTLVEQSANLPRQAEEAKTCLEESDPTVRISEQNKTVMKRIVYMLFRLEDGEREEDTGLYNAGG
ncbi:unnamed protein product [Protopolystoma xenopodis]|uniref:Uncharacterized protein n=1 Tax=Protopolystoma xenopodis TaxID=117903 RepID=A0A448XRK1_9PLAT|nr:unnamed protein product [Protopolystoma xenopodis]